MNANADPNTIVSAQVSKDTRNRANSILKEKGVTLSSYIRHCLERLVAGTGVEPRGNDYQPLAGFLLREIEAGGPEAEALLKKLTEIAALPVGAGQ